MIILLTNDDGIFAKGILALYQELKKIANVTIVAPDSERSSVGHGITLAKPIFVKKVSRQGKFFGYGVRGLPADCIKFATSVLLKKKPDAVVSGINLGPNEGCSVFYSGTVAGAREGAILGIPSIAVSLATFRQPDYSYAAQFAARLVLQVHKNRIHPETFLNLNIPNLKPSLIRGVKICRQCMVPIHGEFTKHKDPHGRTYYWMKGKDPVTKKDLSIDTYALSQGYITITPVHCNLTDRKTLQKISRWKI